jgi:hypothetical protein
MLYILVSSLSYLGGLLYSLLRSSLNFFIRNVFYYLESNKAVRYLLEPLIYRTHSQHSLGAILTLFSLMIKVLVTQMLAAFNPISSRSLNGYRF